MAISTIDTSSISGLGYGFKNRIINGAMTIDQRNAGASVSAVHAAYSLDRWQCTSYMTAGAVTGKFTIQQNAGSVTPPTGFNNYLGVTSSASTSIDSGSFFLVQQHIEGFNVADLGWGAAGAASITLSFWVRSSLTGTFGGCLNNSDQTRSYPFTYTISSANTWEQKSVTVAGDTSGTWLKTNGDGLVVRVGLGVGSTYSGTAGSWSGSDYRGATGATSVVGTSGATFYITGVQLEKGTVATGFDYRPYGTELALCQRYYYQLSYNSAQILGVGVSNGTADARCVFYAPVTMRTTPTGVIPTGTNYFSVDKPGTGFVTFNSLGIAYQTPNSVLLYGSVSGMTTGYALVMYLQSSGSYVGLSAEL